MEKYISFKNKTFNRLFALVTMLCFLITTTLLLYGDVDSYGEYQIISTISNIESNLKTSLDMVTINIVFYGSLASLFIFIIVGIIKSAISLVVGTNTGYISQLISAFCFLIIISFLSFNISTSTDVSPALFFVLIIKAIVINLYIFVGNLISDDSPVNSLVITTILCKNILISVLLILLLTPLYTFNISVYNYQTASAMSFYENGIIGIHTFNINMRIVLIIILLMIMVASRIIRDGLKKNKELFDEKLLLLLAFIFIFEVYIFSINKIGFFSETRFSFHSRTQRAILMTQLFFICNLVAGFVISIVADTKIKQNYKN